MVCRCTRAKKWWGSLNLRLGILIRICTTNTFFTVNSLYDVSICRLCTVVRSNLYLHSSFKYLIIYAINILCIGVFEI